MEQFLKISLNDFFVRRFRRSDKGIIGHIQALPERVKLRCQPVAIGLGLDARLGGGLLDFLTMFVKASKKKDVAPSKSPVPSEHICGDRRVGMADVRDVIDVINRRGDVKGMLIAHGQISSLTVEEDENQRLVLTRLTKLAGEPTS
jgi:hypothetical protein